MRVQPWRHLPRPCIWAWSMNISACVLKCQIRIFPERIVGDVFEHRAVLCRRPLAVCLPVAKVSEQSVCPLQPRGNVFETISTTWWSAAIPAQSEQPGHNSDDRLCPSRQPLSLSWCLCASLSGWFGRSLIIKSHARNTPAFPQCAIQWYSHVSHEAPVALGISQGFQLYTSPQFARFAKAGGDDSTKWKVPGL